MVSPECPNCGEELREDPDVCSVCNWEVEECPNCGEELREDPDVCSACDWEVEKCPNCGEELGEKKNVCSACNWKMGGDFSGPATRSLEPRETVDPSFSYRAPEAPSADDDLDLREFIENIEKETAAKKAAKAKHQKERVERVGKKRGCLPIVIVVFAISSGIGMILDACEGNENTAWPESFDQRVAGVIFED